jgi:hypothetical protein
MKDRLKLKFLNHKHKWIWFHTDSDVFKQVINCFTDNIATKSASSKLLKELTKCFKFHEKVFLKYAKNVGRKNFQCVCYIIDKENNKIEILLKPEDVLSANILSSSPKSLKLYKTKDKDKNNWKKPDDGFIDPIDYPPVDEELTELGYELYKEWQLEIQRSGLSAEEYKKKLFSELTGA